MRKSISRKASSFFFASPIMGAGDNGGEEGERTVEAEGGWGEEEGIEVEGGREDGGEGEIGAAALKRN